MAKPKHLEAWGRSKARERHGEGAATGMRASATDHQAPQDPEDKHGPKYDNDASGWVRGVGDPYPNFDRKNAWRGGKLREK